MSTALCRNCGIRFAPWDDAAIFCVDCRARRRREPSAAELERRKLRRALSWDGYGWHV
jgi:hypothetical protein